MSARTVPCVVVAYTAAWNACAFWREGDAGEPGTWTTDPTEATTLAADEAAQIAGMFDDHARTRGSWNHYRHAAASDYRQEPTT